MYNKHYLATISPHLTLFTIKKISYISFIKEEISKVWQKDDDAMVHIREEFRYGTKLSMREELLNEYFDLAKKAMEIWKEVLEGLSVEGFIDTNLMLEIVSLSLHVSIEESI